MALSIDLSSISHSFAASYEQEADGLECLPIASEKALFGRIEETTSLLEAYQSLLRTKQPQSVIVHGKSGSGKTSLVGTLLGPVFDTNGYFVSGKYFQNEAVQEPFSAIMAAFSDLCDLVAQSNDFNDLKRQQLADDLDAHVRLLVKVVTNLTSLTGVINACELVEASSIAKFKSACKAFLHTLASDDHPIVIFLDDVQWADEGSIALIQTMLQDANMFNVMLVLAYRDEESEYIEDILNHAQNPIDIALSELDADDVFHMVTSILGAKTKEIRLLSDLVTNRTSGNPFHVAMFLETIEHEGLMTYGGADSSWVFDVDEIREAIMVSETLADLLTRKIDRISVDIKESLKVASLLGYRFEESILLSITCHVLERDQPTLERQKHVCSDSISTASTLARASLSEAVKEGFIEKTSDGYQFTHDKLQSSFQALVDDSEENELHLLIGAMFLKERAKEHSYIYKAAVHLNAATAPLDHQQRTRLARINLDAANYCVEISAFDRADVALEYGLDCLSSEERWYKEYTPLKLELMEALARNQLIVGKFEECKETIRDAISHNTSIEMKISFQLIRVEVCMTGNEAEESLVASHEALATLGIKMPHKVKTRHILARLLKVKWMLKNKSDKDIVELPFTKNPLISQSVKLLVNVCSHYLLRENQETAIWATLVAVEITLKEGLSLHSPGAFTFYGIAELVTGNQDRACRFGKLALSMLDRMESREADCTTIGTARAMLTFRKDPLQNLVKPLSQAATSGFRYGDISYATHCIIQCHNIGIHLGTNLATLEEFMRESYDTISDIGQDGLLPWLQPTMQYVLNMQADVANWKSLPILSGEMMNENRFLDQALARNETLLIVTTYLAKARIAGDFGQFELAETFFDYMTKNFGNDAVKFSYGCAPYYWDVARAHLSLYRTSGMRHHLRQARKYMKLLQQLVKDGHPDASLRLAFLVAQQESVRKRPLDNATARTAYQHALKQLAESEYFHLEGLLSENAGFDFLRRGLGAEANVYFRRALYIYEHEWGSTAKYNQLSETMRFWMEPASSTIVQSTQEKLLSGLCIDIAMK